MLTKAQLLPPLTKNKQKIKTLHHFFGGDITIYMYPPPRLLFVTNYGYPLPTTPVTSFLNLVMSGSPPVRTEIDVVLGTYYLVLSIFEKSNHFT